MRPAVEIGAPPAELALSPRASLAPCPRLRRAEGPDVDAIWTLKRQLHITPAAPRVVEGGFLLGVSRARYAELIAHANVWVLEDAGAERALVGFAVTLPDPVLRATDVWSRRAGIAWIGTPPEIADHARVGYFDQIACLPGRQSQLGVPALALRALLDLIETGHQHVFATVVREPVHNLAALHMLDVVGARLVGRLAEHHEDVGALVSDVYHLDHAGPNPPAPWSDTALGRRILRVMARASG